MNILSFNRREFTNEVINLVRLDSTPVGIKLYEKSDDVPKQAEEIKKQYTFCQFVTLARINQKICKVTKKNLWCAIAQTYLGLIRDFPEDIALRVVPARTATEEAYWNILNDIPRVEGGSKEAVLVSPLDIMPVDPDIILFFVNSDQLLRLLHGISYHNGERVASRTAAECGTCGEAVATTYCTGKPAIGVPCLGTRGFALSSPAEVILGLPISYAENFLEGLRITHYKWGPYPIRRWVNTPQSVRALYTKGTLTKKENEELYSLMNRLNKEDEVPDGS